jgi:hypothetical protein
MVSCVFVLYNLLKLVYKRIVSAFIFVNMKIYPTNIVIVQI